MSAIICNKYKLKERIGEGSFGNVFLSYCIETNQEVAIKLERLTSKRLHLRKEYQVIKNLNALEYKVGIPKLYWYGTEGDY